MREGKGRQLHALWISCEGASFSHSGTKQGGFCHARADNSDCPLFGREFGNVAVHESWYAFFEARATSSSNLESRSFRMGDSFDFL